jgi:hypothetical protein
MADLIGFDSSLLIGWYNAKSTLAASRAAVGVTPSAAAAARDHPSVTEANVIPPWDTKAKPVGLDVLAREVLADGVFFRDEEFTDLKASDDTKGLFALHQGLKRLYALASEAADKSTTDLRRAFLNRRFQEGMAQFDKYLSGLDLQTASLARGEMRTVAESALKISRGVSEYVSAVVHDGPFDAEVPAFQGAAAFTVNVTRNGLTDAVQIDLAGMGATPRTLDNVAAFINTQLEVAGALSRFSRVKIGQKDENGVIPGSEFGFKITGVSTEKLSFVAASGAPSLYIAGLSGSGATQSGQLTKINDLGAAAPETQYIKRIEGDAIVTVNDKGEDVTSTGVIRTRATALGPAGEVYMLAETDGAVGGATIKGATDLVLLKYDSTGRQVWSRVLGAADTAAAADLVVDASGNVVITGKVTGGLGTTTIRGGSDAFAAKYSATGAELWLQRFGTGVDDAPSAIALGAGGEIYIGGATSGGMGGAMLGGGKDGFVRALDSAGKTLWTRQIGTEGADLVKSLAVADDGALLVGSMTAGEGRITKYSATDPLAGAIWSHDLGAMDGGELSAIAVDGDAIYLAGGAGAASALAGAASGHTGGRDAFLVRLQDGGASVSESYTRFLGTDSDDSARDLVVQDGAVYLTGKTGGELPGGAEQSGGRNSFVAKLNAADGALAWTTQISGRGGLSEALSIAVDPQGDSVLEAFGLPRGTLDYGGGSLLTERTALHPGDHFYVAVDGGRKKKITIDAKDTLLSLTFKINSALVLDGRAQVGRSSKGDSLRIKPAGDSRIEIFSGADGKDALGALGLEPGLVRNLPDDKDKDREKASDAPPLYALDIPARLSVAAKAEAQTASEALDKALTTIRAAYRDLHTDPALAELMNKKTGPAPPYYAAQLANFEAGLARLSAGPDPSSFLI